ncbi:MAG: DUF309 domain-containing protein [Chloroflexi bacterium]|nr:DUF309 domain-containing protein [Chloroflexota bacterium]
MSSSSSLIALAGTPGWATTAETLLHQNGFDVVQYHNLANLIDQLIEDYPVLLLVDGDQADWSMQVSAPKTEQATRRIPILVIASNPELASQAINAGAEGFLMASDLSEKLLPQVVSIARLPDPEVAKELDCQCQESLPPLVQRAVEEFNSGAYYVQHDYFEKQWMAESGPVRELYRAALQVGVAYYHITRGNHAGALRMLQRSMQWFTMLPDVCQGIDVRRLRDDAQRVRVALQAMNPTEITSFDRSLLRPIHLIEDRPVEK